MWREGSLSYHQQTLGGLLRLDELLKGYSDPPGYRHSRDGKRFEDLDLADRFPILQKARTIPEQLQYPSGRPVVVHDTWSRDRGRDGTTSTGPILLPAYGHARLGLGRGDDQVQVHLHFSGGYGHQHDDLLSLTLFARGGERLSDIGYTHTKYRTWAESTLSHNTVMVDGREQEAGSEARPNDGNLLLYVPGDETFQAVEASGPRAYPGITREYRRMLILIGVAPGRLTWLTCSGSWAGRATSTRSWATPTTMARSRATCPGRVPATPCFPRASRCGCRPGRVSPERRTVITSPTPSCATSSVRGPRGPGPPGSRARPLPRVGCGSTAWWNLRPRCSRPGHPRCAGPDPTMPWSTGSRCRC